MSSSLPDRLPTSSTTPDLPPSKCSHHCLCLQLWSKWLIHFPRVLLWSYHAPQLPCHPVGFFSPSDAWFHSQRTTCQWHSATLKTSDEHPISCTQPAPSTLRLQERDLSSPWCSDQRPALVSASRRSTNCLQSSTPCAAHSTVRA